MEASKLYAINIPDRPDNLFNLDILKQEQNLEIYFADLQFNPVTRIIKRKQLKVYLTPNESSLLEFFIRNPNQILTRENIARHAWHRKFDPLTNIIEVYVYYLRKKIDKDFENKLIHNIRNAGYIFKE